MNKNEFLEHYGIKRRSGRFRWGSGKRPYQSGSGPISSKKELTNDELRTRIERQKLINETLRLQREFKSLSKQEKTEGRKFVEEILKDSTKKTISNLIVVKTNQAIQNQQKSKTIEGNKRERKS